MISPFPSRDQHERLSGVAEYSQRLVEHLPHSVRVEVVAQKGARNATFPNAIVSEVWSVGKIRAPLQIAYHLVSRRPEGVHFQHEFRILGSLIGTYGLVFVLVLLRLRRIRVVTTLHCVVPRDQVGRSFWQGDDRRRRELLYLLVLRVSYRLLVLASDELVVHDDFFAGVLVNDYHVSRSKINVIPHGANSGSVESDVGTSADPSYGSTRPAALDSDGPRILALGFLASYKRPELLAELLEDGGIPGAHYTFAVGFNPQLDSSTYRARYASLRQRVELAGAQWLGYVADDLLDNLLADTDVLVLAYTAPIGASGVGALAQAHGVALCWSRELAPLFGEGPTCFSWSSSELGDAVRAALIRKRAGSASIAQAVGLYAPWDEVANATVFLWKDRLKSNSH